MAAKTQIIIGLLAILITSIAIYVTVQEMNVRMRIDNDKSTFYVFDNNRWLISGIEYNKIYNGTKLMIRNVSGIFIETFKGNNSFTIIRHTPYKNGVEIIDTYYFEGNLTNVEEFPVYHTIEILNGKGLIYEYSVTDLQYNDSTRTAINPERFGRNMKIEWQDGSYLARIYQTGILKIRYKINKSNQTFSVRLFDPTTNCNSCSDCTTKIAAAASGDIIQMTVSVLNYNVADCIDFNGKDNITFDCLWHTLDGVKSTGSYAIDLSSGSDNNTIRNCITQEFWSGIRISGSNSSNISNMEFYSMNYGVELTGVSTNNNFSNIYAHFNSFGIYVTSNIYAGNKFINLTSESNYDYGINLLSVTNPVSILNSTISKNNIPINMFAAANNIFSGNNFTHNYHPALETFTETNRLLNLGNEVTFTINMEYLNGSACSACIYNLTVYPTETIQSSKSTAQITGNFTVSRYGIYTFVVNITDPYNNNEIRNYIYLVNATGSQTTLFYLRSLKPTHNQPWNTVLYDTGTMWRTAPSITENVNCTIWIQTSPDELPNSLPFFVNTMNMSVWYNNSIASPGFGIQRYARYNNGVDVSQGVASTTVFTLNNTAFSNLNWTMDYPWSFYFLAFKIGFSTGDTPSYRSNATDPSIANITTTYTTTPEIRTISGNITMLSATSPGMVASNATVILDGFGTANITVVMSNTTVNYTATYDGNACNNANCNLTSQSNGILNFTVILGSVHSLNITEFLSISPQFVSPTLNNNSYTQNNNWIYINVSFDQNGSTCILESIPSTTQRLRETDGGYAGDTYGLRIEGGIYYRDVEHNMYGHDYSLGTHTYYKGVLWINISDAYGKNITKATLNLLNLYYTQTCGSQVTVYAVTNQSVNIGASACQTMGYEACWNAMTSGTIVASFNASIPDGDWYPALDITNDFQTAANNASQDPMYLIWFDSSVNASTSECSEAGEFDGWIDAGESTACYINYTANNWTNTTMNMDTSKRYCSLNSTDMLNGTAFYFRTWVNSSSNYWNFTEWRMITVNFSLGIADLNSTFGPPNTVNLRWSVNASGNGCGPDFTTVYAQPRNQTGTYGIFYLCNNGTLAGNVQAKLSGTPNTGWQIMMSNSSSVSNVVGMTTSFKDIYTTLGSNNCIYVWGYANCTAVSVNPGVDIVFGIV